MERITEDLSSAETRAELENFVNAVQRAHFDCITEQIGLGEATQICVEYSRFIANGLEFGWEYAREQRDRYE